MVLAQGYISNGCEAWSTMAGTDYIPNKYQILQLLYLRIPTKASEKVYKLAGFGKKKKKSFSKINNFVSIHDFHS